MYIRQGAHIVCAPPSGPILHGLAAPGGDPGAARIVRAEAKDKAEQERKAEQRATVLQLAGCCCCFCAQERAALPRGPVSRGPRAEEKSRSDRAHDVRELSERIGTCVRKTP